MTFNFNFKTQNKKIIIYLFKYISQNCKQSNALFQGHKCNWTSSNR